jgi:hypothetical protein
MSVKDKPDRSSLTASQQDRRSFMEKAGKLAAYTPPLMLGLLLPGEHAIASGGYDPNTKQKKDKKKKKKK